MAEKSETAIAPAVKDLRFGFGIPQRNSDGGYDTKDPRDGWYHKLRQQFIDNFRKDAINILGDASRLREYLETKRCKYLKSQWRKYLSSELKMNLKFKCKNYLKSKLKPTHSPAYKKHLKSLCGKYMESKLKSLLKAKLKANPAPQYLPSLPTFDVDDLDNFLLHEHFASKLQFCIENEKLTLQELDLKCAQRALAYFNEKNGVHYELEEVLGSMSVLLVGRWHHCNFRARPVDGSRFDDPSSKLFFAELHDFRPTSTIRCHILAESEAVLGCEMCPSPMAHPQSGFEKGLPGTLPERCIWNKAWDRRCL